MATTLLIKGRIGQIAAFAEELGAKKIKDGQYWAYRLVLSDENELAMYRYIEEELQFYDRVWVEEDPTTREIAGIDYDVQEEEGPEHLHPAWANMARQMVERGLPASNYDCKLTMLDQLACMRNTALRRRSTPYAHLKRLLEMYEQLQACGDAEAGGFYATIRDEVLSFAKLYWGKK